MIHGESGVFLRKMITIAILLFVLTDTCVAEYCVPLGSTTALLSTDYQCIIEPGIYEEIKEVSEDRFIAKRQGKSVLLDQGGVILSEGSFISLEYSDGLVIGCEKGLYGLMNLNGQLVYDFNYESIVSMGEGGFLGLLSSRVIALDENGNTWDTGLMARSLDSKSGNKLLGYESENNCYGYCDENGKAVLEPIYDFAEPFKNGIAVVVLNGKRGVIDEEGRFILEPIYDEIKTCSAFLACKEGPGRISVFDMKGNPIEGFDETALHFDVCNDHLILYSDTAVRVFDSFGNLVSMYDSESVITAGLNNQLIVSNGGWGENCVSLVETSNSYQDLQPLCLIDGEARYIYRVSDVSSYMSDRIPDALVYTDEESVRYGLVDSDGVVIIPAVYRMIFAAGNDLYTVETDDGWKLIDLAGNEYWSYIDDVHE